MPSWYIHSSGCSASYIVQLAQFIHSSSYNTQLSCDINHLNMQQTHDQDYQYIAQATIHNFVAISITLICTRHNQNYHGAPQLLVIHN